MEQLLEILNSEAFWAFVQQWGGDIALASALGWLVKKYRWTYHVLKLVTGAVEKIEPPGAEIKPVKAQVEKASGINGEAAKVKAFIRKVKA